MQVDDFFLPLSTVRHDRALRRGVELAVDDETVRVEFIFADVVRVRISRGGAFDAQPTHAVERDDFGTPPFRVRRTRRSVVLTTDALRVRVARAPFAVDVTRADGSPVARPVKGWGYRALNDAWVVRRRCGREDRFLGLGEKTGGLDHRGRRLQLWNHDLLGPDHDGVVADTGRERPENDPLSDRFDPYYVSIPLLYHVVRDDPARASASFIDNGYRLRYDLDGPTSYQVAAEGGQLTEYLFAGPALRDILRRYTQLTGRMPAPPLWALGHHQCRWHDYSQAAWEDLGRTYRDRRIPCDALWLDIHYMDGYRVFTWDRQRFPDPAGALRRARRRGFRAITIIDPGVKHEPGNPVFDEGRDRNLFCKTQSGSLYVGQVWPGRTVYPDFVKEAARRWWGRLNADHVRSGLAGIWNDMNEPSTGRIPPAGMRFDRDGENAPHDRYHNQYALLMAMGTRDGLKAALPDRRTFILSRAGFAGIQRYAATWTGDNASRWSHLAMSLPMNANLGLSGQPFVGSDVGGFLENCSAELLVRWYQYGTFQPFFRNHACIGTDDQYPWSHGDRAERAIRAAVELRYRLLPYLYTCFLQAHETGEPIQRPLVLDAADDPEAWGRDDQFLFGPHLLVAPVLQQGARQRTLYLPKGTWYDFHSGRALKGGTEVTVPAPLSRCPVFVRAGAVLPLADRVQTTADYAPERLTLRLYPPVSGAPVESLLHEDDGLTERHLAGAFLRTRFRVRRRAGRIELKAGVEGDGYPEHRRKRFRLQVEGSRRATETFDNTGEPFERSLPLDR